MTSLRPTVPSVDAQDVLSPLTDAAIFLIVTVDPGGEAVVRELLPDLAGLRRSVGFRVPAATLSCVTGIGSDVWGRLFAGPRPASLHPFREIEGERHRAVATPGDLLFHIRASRLDVCFELASQILRRLTGAVTVVDEIHGFTYFDQRDLLGFVDGTENPTGAAAQAAVTIGDEDPDFAGGSYVVTQKYLHDLATWNALPTEEQEKVIGRTKLTNIQLADDVLPTNSHVALNTIVDPDGTERQILRDNMPFGNVGRGEFGTFYIAYARSPAIVEQMLENMFVGNPPGNYDHILNFSTALSGNLFHVPTGDFLDDPPAAADVDVVAASSREMTATDDWSDRPPDGSLKIGGLRGDTTGTGTG